MHRQAVTGTGTLPDLPQARIIGLTSFYEPEMIQKMLDAGAISFLMEGVSATELAQAIRSARNGNSMLSLEIQDLLRGQRPCVLGVLRIAINGALNNAEIARELTISLSTTKFHVSSILTKLGVCSRPEARP